MATKASIAISKHHAVERISAALNRLLDGAALEPVEVPRLGRYPELLHNQQLEAIADALEQLSPAPEVEDDLQAYTSELANIKEKQDVAELANAQRLLEKVNDFTVTTDGVIVATDEDGDPVVSDGQDEPDDLEDVDFDDPSDDETEDEVEKPARKRKGK